MQNPNLTMLKLKANKLPRTAGVYIMKDKSGNIIYIGKAKALKNRVTQYFGKGTNHTEKVRKMVEHVEDFEYILCDSEFEALILENSLIKMNKPKYNILLKDDKGYHYIKITNEKWRKLTTAMQIDNDGAEYIGPYYSSFVVKDTVDEVRKIFALPSCNRSFDKYTKPCLNYHIGLCDAPCKANVTLEEYNENLDAAIKYIKSGAESMKELLTRRMLKASDNLDFEYAAKLRDRINAIGKLSEKQKVVMCTYKSEDIIASALLGETACISIFTVRNSKLTDKKTFTVDGVADKSELYSDVLLQYYGESNDIPPRILLDFMPVESELITRWLCEKSGRKTELILPQKGDQKSLVKMCKNNAADSIAQIKDRNGREMTALNELAVLLGLDKVPRIIESYDISNTAGDKNVGGMVVFHDGRPYKPHYRKFNIKSFIGQDDYRSLNEVLDRRFSEYEKKTDEAFSTLPDLILLDGGRGQLSAVEPILKKHGITVPIFGMVKDSKHKTRAITAGGADISVKANRSAYTLVTNIQDEVHRFAITFHQQKRTQKMLSSTLTSIEGVGDKTAIALLKHFKTLKAIKAASADELSAVKGVTKKAAENIVNFYKN